LSVPGIPADSLPDIFLISPLRADFIRWQPAQPVHRFARRSWRCLCHGAIARTITYVR